MPADDYYGKGKRFEAEVFSLLIPLKAAFGDRVAVRPQELIVLNDGRKKFIDFGFDYRLSSSNHQIAIECQDREVWSSEILDKIKAIRDHSRRNRFWFIYRSDDFLTAESRGLLESHGVMHFSLRELKDHLDAVARDLKAAELIAKREKTDYEAQSDPSMLAEPYDPTPKSWWRW